MNLTIGPIIVTAWAHPDDGSHAIGCPLCREWSEISPGDLDKELPCPNCEGALKVNPFTIDSDWRPIAKAWWGRR